MHNLPYPGKKVCAGIVRDTKRAATMYNDEGKRRPKRTTDDDGQKNKRCKNQEEAHPKPHSGVPKVVPEIRIQYKLYFPDFDLIFRKVSTVEIDFAMLCTCTKYVFPKFLSYTRFLPF